MKKLIKQKDLNKDLMSAILEGSGLVLPLEMNGKTLFEFCKENDYSRYIVSMNLLGISNTTGRSISLSDEYIILISEDFEVNIDRVISVK